MIKPPEFDSVPSGLDPILMETSNILFKNFKRFYKVDLSVHGFDFERTTPEFLYFDDFYCDEHSWVRTLELLARYLVKKHSSSFKSLYNFRGSWSDALLFREDKAINHREVVPGLYVNCNHTAVHSIWFIGELLKYFGVQPKRATLIIHRPPDSEPEHLQTVFIDAYKTGFRTFLIEKEGKTPENADKILSNIAFMNRYVPEIIKSLKSWFLICDTTSFSRLKAAYIPHMLGHHSNLPRKAFALFEKYINLMSAYLKRCINSNAY